MEYGVFSVPDNNIKFVRSIFAKTSDFEGSYISSDSELYNSIIPKVSIQSFIVS